MAYCANLNKGYHQGYITACQLAKSGIADHVLMEGHKLGECRILKKIAQAYKLDAAESLFITKNISDENCVNLSAPPIQSPLFKFAQ